MIFSIKGTELFFDQERNEIQVIINEHFNQPQFY